MLQTLMSKLEPSQGTVCVSTSPLSPQSLEDVGLKCSTMGKTPKKEQRSSQQPPDYNQQSVIEENIGKNLISIFITHNILNCRGIPGVSFNRLAYQMFSIQVFPRLRGVQGQH